MSTNSPFTNNTQMVFQAQIEFNFGTAYSYSSYKASMIDALVKFCSILIYFFVIWAICSTVVKHFFMKQLKSEIVQIDEQVHLTYGLLPVSPFRSFKNFSEKLSFSKIYHNQF
jgi:hypothetical protein